MNTTPQHTRVSLTISALLVAAGAGIAQAQVRVSFPMTGMPSYRTASPGPACVRGVVGGGACAAPVSVTRPVLGGTVVSRGPARCDPRVLTTGSGLTVNGRYNGDNLDVAFHLGSPTVGVVKDCRPVCDPCVVQPPYGYPYGWGYGWGWGWDDRTYVDNSYLRYSVIDGALVQPAYMPAPAPSPAPAATPPPATTLELATEELRSGEADEAVNLFQLHLRSNPDDAGAMRSLAVALLLSNEPVQAAAMMRMAYRTDPGLAESPMSLVELFDSDRDVKNALRRAVTYANKDDSASGWLTVATIMQAEGRNPTALKMIAKARKAGLEDAVAEAMTDALDG